MYVYKYGKNGWSDVPVSTPGCKTLVQRSIILIHPVYVGPRSAHNHYNDPLLELQGSPTFRSCPIPTIRGIMTGGEIWVYEVNPCPSNTRICLKCFYCLCHRPVQSHRSLDFLFRRYVHVCSKTLAGQNKEISRRVCPLSFSKCSNASTDSLYP